MGHREPLGPEPADGSQLTAAEQAPPPVTLLPSTTLRSDPAYGKWAAEHELDTTQIEREGDANTVYWVKPLWWTIGAGLGGIALFVGQIWFGPLSARLGLHLGDALSWLRTAAMLVGGLLTIMAWPAPVTRDRVPDDPTAPPLPDGHQDLDTKR
jgi:hypothetical protein